MENEFILHNYRTAGLITKLKLKATKLHIQGGLESSGSILSKKLKTYYQNLLLWWKWNEEKAKWFVKIGVYLVTLTNFTFQAPLENHDTIE